VESSTISHLKWYLVLLNFKECFLWYSFIVGVLFVCLIPSSLWKKKLTSNKEINCNGLIAIIKYIIHVLIFSHASMGKSWYLQYFSSNGIWFFLISKSVFYDIHDKKYFQSLFVKSTARMYWGNGTLEKYCKYHDLILSFCLGQR
jgi:hypothetical protein